MISFGLVLAALAASTNAYWLMGVENFITTERIDPIISPGEVSAHTHSVLGGSNFRFTTTSDGLRKSDCTSIPIPQDKSAYWFPHLYFQWNNGSFTSLDGGAVIYYLFSDTPGTTTAFPDDFRMISGDPALRSYDPNSFAQQAVTFLCLDFNGVTTKHNSIPTGSCPSGIRAQINFPSCWDGKNSDSADHKSHVAFLSGGPDSGTCSDPKFPVTLPRIFLEVYWGSQTFDSARSQAKNPDQPFVFAQGDPTGYGYHADFINGWDSGVLQKAVDGCNCNPYGDPTCCAQKGIFDLNQGKTCRITKSVDEQTTGTLSKLPGNNPVVGEGPRAQMLAATSTPNIIAPVFAYTGNTPTQTGTVVSKGSNLAVGGGDDAPAASSAAVSSSAAHAGASSSAPAAASSAAPAAASSVTAPAAASSAAPAAASSVAAPAAASSAAHAGASSVAAPAAASSAAHAGASSVAAPAAASSAAHAASSVAAAPAASSAAAGVPAPASSPSSHSNSNQSSSSTGSCKRSVKRMHHARRLSHDDNAFSR